MLLLQIKGSLMSADLTEHENAIIGGTAAFVETIILQPTIFAKNAVAQRIPLTLDPRVLYRGIGPALANEMGQLGLQFGAAGALKRTFPQGAAGEVAAASTAGVIIALFASPCELLMIQQQRFGTGLLATPVHVLREHGWMTMFGRGLGLAMTRDAIYVGGMLGATPVINRWLLGGDSGSTSGGATDSQSASALALASMAASIFGGIFGAVLSHPLDVVKTCMQGDLQRATYGGVGDTLRVLLQEGGYSRYAPTPRGLLQVVTLLLPHFRCSIHTAV